MAPPKLGVCSTLTGESERVCVRACVRACMCVCVCVHPIKGGVGGERNTEYQELAMHKEIKREYFPEQLKPIS